MSRIEEAFKVVRSMERGEPQPTALHKLAEQHKKMRIAVEREKHIQGNKRMAHLNHDQLNP